MDLGDELLNWIAQIGNLGLQLLWLIVHFIISIWNLAQGTVHALESFVISSGLLKRYKILDVGKVRYLAIVIDSEDARETSKVIKLLQWLSTIGLKHVCLYDPEGVLKKSKETILQLLSRARLSEVLPSAFLEASEKDVLLDKKQISLEFASFADGKEAMAKAANLLFVKHYLGGDLEKPVFTESHVTEALNAIGSGGPDPDLLLVYGPARCHMGFPAWRIRYTEIIHMGSLRSMKYGSLLKAIRKFTMVRQNYGK